MPMKTGDDYLESLGSLNLKAHIRGQRTSPDDDGVDRMKVLRLIENLVAGSGAVGYLIESMHGAGPPTAQRIMISRQANIENKIKQVQALLHIDNDS